MTIFEAIVYASSLIAFIVTMVGISRENKVVQIAGTIAMAAILGTAMWYGWLYG